MFEQRTQRGAFTASHYNLTAPNGRQSLLTRQELAEVLDLFAIAYKIKDHHLIVYLGNDRSIELHIEPIKVNIH